MIFELFVYSLVAAELFLSGHLDGGSILERDKRNAKGHVRASFLLSPADMSGTTGNSRIEELMFGLAG